MKKTLNAVQTQLMSRAWPKQLGLTGAARLQSMALGIAIGRQLRMVGDPMRSIEDGFAEVVGGRMLSNVQITQRISTLMNYLPMLDLELVEKAAFATWADRYNALYPQPYIAPVSLLGLDYARYHDYVFATDRQWSKEELMLLNADVITTLDVVNIMIDAYAATAQSEQAVA